MDGTCSTYKFWHSGVGNPAPHTKGECWRPPVLVVGPGGVDAQFPKTSATDWCGQWGSLGKRLASNVPRRRSRSARRDASKRFLETRFGISERQEQAIPLPLHLCQPCEEKLPSSCDAHIPPSFVEQTCCPVRILLQLGRSPEIGLYSPQGLRFTLRRAWNGSSLLILGQLRCFVLHSSLQSCKRVRPRNRGTFAGRKPKEKGRPASWRGSRSVCRASLNAPAGQMVADRN
jgi:hypothetical protein